MTAAAATTGPAATTAEASPRLVVLPTGDRVLTEEVAGRPAFHVLSAAGRTTPLAVDRLSVGDHHYVVPTEAKPFFGSLLDASLFDVPALARVSSPAGIPVSLRVAAGATPAVPGLHVTGRQGTSVTGTLDPAQATAFRAALSRAARTATTQHRLPASLFGGVTAMTVVGTPVVAAPDFPMVTLQLSVLGTDGAPLDFAVVELVNTDDSRKALQYVVVQGGTGRVSVPVGHYSALTSVDEYNADFSQLVATRIAVVPDYSVTANLQTLSLDLRTATAQVSVTTPRPAATQRQIAEIDRLSAHLGSPALQINADRGPDTTMLVSPTAAARVGRLYTVTGHTMVGTGGGTPYSYDLTFVDESAVPSSLAHSVSTPELARVRSSYYSDTDRGARKTRAFVHPFEPSVGATDVDLATPVARDELVFGASDVRWSDTLVAHPSFHNYYGGLTYDSLRRYVAGRTVAVDWLRGPLVPAPPQQGDGDDTTHCVDCRSGDILHTTLAPFTDTTPGHGGFNYTDFDGTLPTTYRLSSGGTTLDGGPGGFFSEVTVPSARAPYVLAMSDDHSAEGTQTSTTASTTLRFGSGNGLGASMPSTWSCLFVDPASPQPCHVLPVLTTVVPLPTDLHNRLAVGRTTFPLIVRPQLGADRIAVTAATLAVSVDGSTFVPAVLTRTGDGHYDVSLTTPAAWAGKPVDLRVTATDAAGDTLTQTTQAAFLAVAR